MKAIITAKPESTEATEDVDLFREAVMKRNRMRHV